MMQPIYHNAWKTLLNNRYNELPSSQNEEPILKSILIDITSTVEKFSKFHQSEKKRSYNKY